MNTLEVKNVSKRFRIYHEKHETLKEAVLFRRRATYEELWVLRDISFDVAAGETLGIIGENGSGKSTLLKIFAGILHPEKGEISVNGKVSALLELGAGFHPDLTGRENIYLNGAILQLSKREIDQRFDEIVSFSELQNFIDQPVKSYSSGMYARLGFAIAVNVNPDILLIDEVLAVGDQFFQSKCYEKINQFQRNGKTIVFVSHDLDAVEKICDRVIFLREGSIVDEGISSKVIRSYRAFVAEKDRQYHDAQATLATADRFGTREAEIVSVELLNSNGEKTSTVCSGDNGVIRARVKFHADVLNPIFGMIIRASDETYLYDTNTLWRAAKTGLFKNDQEVEVDFRQNLSLVGGTYLVTVAVAYPDATRFCDWRTNVLSFHVEDDGRQKGMANLNAVIGISESGNKSGKKRAILEC